MNSENDIIGRHCRHFSIVTTVDVTIIIVIQRLSPIRNIFSPTDRGQRSNQSDRFKCLVNNSLIIIAVNKSNSVIYIKLIKLHMNE